MCRTQLILVYNLPGSGKSYFSKALSELTQIARYNSDQIRTDMGLKGNYSEEAKSQVYERLLELAKKQLEQGKSVIIDANFSLPRQRQVFKHLAYELQAGFYAIILEADESISLNRLNQERPYSEANARVYYTLKNAALYNDEETLHLQSTNENLEEMLLRTMSYLQYE